MCGKCRLRTISSVKENGRDIVKIDAALAPRTTSVGVRDGHEAAPGPSFRDGVFYGASAACAVVGGGSRCRPGAAPLAPWRPLRRVAARRQAVRQAGRVRLGAASRAFSPHVQRAADRDRPRSRLGPHGALAARSLLVGGAARCFAAF